MAYKTGYCGGYSDLRSCPPFSSLIFDFAQEVLDCVCEALDDLNCPCPCRRCVIVGEPAFDNCCDDGQLTISLNRLFVHREFPAQESQPHFCSSPLAGDFTVTLLRCAPVVKDDGSPPTCEELDESSLQIYTEMYIVERAILCCLSAKKRKLKFVMRDTVPITPQGGCVGFHVRFTAELPELLPT